MTSLCLDMLSLCCIINCGCLQMIQREYEELYNGALECVHPVYKPQTMTQLCGEYSKLRLKLLDTCDQYELRMRKGKKIKRQTVRSLSIAAADTTPAIVAMVQGSAPAGFGP